MHNLTRPCHAPVARCTVSTSIFTKLSRCCSVGRQEDVLSMPNCMTCSPGLDGLALTQVYVIDPGPSAPNARSLAGSVECCTLG